MPTHTRCSTAAIHPSPPSLIYYALLPLHREEHADIAANARCFAERRARA
ncbi:MAG: hypothetical protein JNK56_18155 [Myxococcales bacterium]|nr:hypothetical protein [Myxococcales bacterium]